MNYEFNLMQCQSVGVIAKRLCAAAETAAAAHEVDDNTCIPSGPTGWGVKMISYYMHVCFCKWLVTLHKMKHKDSSS